MQIEVRSSFDLNQCLISLCNTLSFHDICACYRGRSHYFIHDNWRCDSKLVHARTNVKIEAIFVLGWGCTGCTKITRSFNRTFWNRSAAMRQIIKYVHFKTSLLMTYISYWQRWHNKACSKPAKELREAFTRTTCVVNHEVDCIIIASTHSCGKT